MNVTTTLILTFSLLMVLAVGGASTQTQNSSEASETPPSRIAINHNETMLVDFAPIQTSNMWDEWLKNFAAFFSTKPTPGGCDDWGCGTNHNETMLIVR